MASKYLQSLLYIITDTTHVTFKNFTEECSVTVNKSIGMRSNLCNAIYCSECVFHKGSKYPNEDRITPTLDLLNEIAACPVNT